MEKINVKITFLEGPLGTAPNDEDVYRNYIGSKAPDAATIEDEVAALGADAVVEKGMTVFPRNAAGQPIFWDYQIKGFFKDACQMLGRIGGKDENGKKKKVNEDPFEIEMRANACQDVKSLTALYMSLSPEMQTMLNPVFKECKQKLQGGNK